MQYLKLFLIALPLLLTSCRGGRPSVPKEQKRIDSTTLADMSKADSFRCIYATVVNLQRPYRVKDFPAPMIAVLLQDSEVLVGIGRQQLVLKRSTSDSMQYICKNKDRSALVAFRNPTTLQVDTIVISGEQGQGQTIMTYAKK